MQLLFRACRLLVVHLQELVSADKEPVQPYINNICALAAKGVSSILVMGRSGCVCPVQLRHFIGSSTCQQQAAAHSTASIYARSTAHLHASISHRLIFLHSWCMALQQPCRAQQTSPQSGAAQSETCYQAQVRASNLFMCFDCAASIAQGP